MEAAALQEYHRSSPLYPHAKEALDALAAEGHEIVFATARDKTTYGEETLELLVRHGLSFPIVFCKGDKTEDLRNLRVDIHVDDHPDILLACAQAGIPTVRFVQPYNGGVRHKNILAVIPCWRYAHENMKTVFVTHEAA